MHGRYASRVFGAAGVFNVAVGASAFVVPSVTARLLGIAPPENPLLMTLAAWLILVFGVGYWMVARNPAGNRDLMLLGALGKGFVLPIMLAAWRRGDVAFAGVVAGGGDLVFALLFLDVRRRTGRVAAVES